MKFKQVVLVGLLGLMMVGCGKKWEHFWGQDTEPEVEYIPMQPNLIEFGVRSVSPSQWADTRFRDARFLSVWACEVTDKCYQLPVFNDDPAKPDCYVVNRGYMIDVYNVNVTFPNVTKIRAQVVM